MNYIIVYPISLRSCVCVSERASLCVCFFLYDCVMHVCESVFVCACVK